MIYNHTVHCEGHAGLVFPMAVVHCDKQKICMGTRCTSTLPDARRYEEDVEVGKIEETASVMA